MCLFDHGEAPLKTYLLAEMKFLSASQVSHFDYGQVYPSGFNYSNKPSYSG